MRGGLAPGCARKNDDLKNGLARCVFVAARRHAGHFAPTQRRARESRAAALSTDTQMNLEMHEAEPYAKVYKECW